MSAGAASAQSVSPYATATKNGTEVPGAWSSMRVGENSAGEWEGDTEAEADPSSSVLSPLPYPTALPLWCGRIHVPAYTTATPAPATDFTASASASGFGESPPPAWLAEPDVPASAAARQKDTSNFCPCQEKYENPAAQRSRCSKNYETCQVFPPIAPKNGSIRVLDEI
ncbi:hypothetical protein B0H14DRAFT_3132496 [Mycena olivaceomarginata]|nr:hypothetical protein B0H14DRAFT_3132496 [Mycena olivaceomarginata]